MRKKKQATNCAYMSVFEHLYCFMFIVLEKIQICIRYVLDIMIFSRKGWRIDVWKK